MKLSGDDLIPLEKYSVLPIFTLPSLSPPTVVSGLIETSSGFGALRVAKRGRVQASWPLLWSLAGLHQGAACLTLAGTGYQALRGGQPDLFRHSSDERHWTLLWPSVLSAQSRPQGAWPATLADQVPPHLAGVF